LPASRLREVANAGLDRDDLLAFWFGESDETTPSEIVEATVASLRRGETFYSHNLGLPELRQGLSEYLSTLHRPISPDRIAVTSSGTSALMLAAQALLGPGDEVVCVTPIWPNLTAQPHILGARVTRVALQPVAGRWQLDLARLLAAVTPATRMLLLNAPANPTGWVLNRAEQQAILAHCRATGTWIVADEVYERLWYGDGVAAPSFLDVAEPDDRLIVTHSFSKSFLMTGWRMGWMVLPPGHEGTMAKLIEFNTGCTPVFVQRGALAALAAEQALVPPLVARLKDCRDRLVAGLQALEGIAVAAPLGGMYAFFQVAGEPDSMALAKRLVAEHGLGLAPGVAFGPEGEGWIRWCFASRDPGRLSLGLDRLRSGLRL
jgi:aspartate/methionine/tyrosine aminotransferase